MEEDAKTEASPGKKRKWFDYDKVVSRAKRNYAKTEEAFESDMKWSLGNANEILTLLETSPADLES
eukprot:4057206-Alexandrium_andersonii.AAC.1